MSLADGFGAKCGGEFFELNPPLRLARDLDTPRGLASGGDSFGHGIILSVRWVSPLMAARQRAPARAEKQPRSVENRRDFAAAPKRV